MERHIDSTMDRGLVRGLFERALDLIFPPTCVGCGHEGLLLCHHCAQEVEPVPAPICARCGRPQARPVEKCALCCKQASFLTHVRSAGLHTWPLREAIHALKYRRQPRMAPYLARYLWAEFMRGDWQTAPIHVDWVLPVPLHASRQQERGYNQAQLLAACFCSYTGLALRTDCMQRSRATQQQVGLTPEERRKNVSGAFLATKEVEGKALLLIDDVTTTGATLHACAAAARAAGAKAAYGLTLAVPPASRQKHASDGLWTVAPLSR